MRKTLLTLFAIVVVLVLAFNLANRTLSIRGRHERQHEQYAAAFKGGDSNVPMLAMDWFSDHGVYFCRVGATGRAFSARDVGHAIQGGSRMSSDKSFGGTNRLLLDEAINRLPPSEQASFPDARKILISGIRSNQWFNRVYDRGNIPRQVEQLYEITEAPLPWVVRTVNGRGLATLDTVNFSGEFKCIASDAPIAVAFGSRKKDGGWVHPGEMQVWDIDRGRTVATLDRIPGTPSYGQGVAISPDGNIVAVASSAGVYAEDWKKRELLWRTFAPLEQSAYTGTCVVIGDKGKSLYLAGAHVIQRWDLATGNKLAVLATNELRVMSLDTSRDGSVMLAGVGDQRGPATRFTLWEPGRNEPSFKLTLQHGGQVGISPDGSQLVVSHWGERTLTVWTWRTGEKTEFPLRAPRGAFAASAMQWSPDRKRLAAVVDSDRATIIVFDTTTWKPLVQWGGGGGRLSFAKDGTLLQLTESQINALDAKAIK